MAVPARHHRNTYADYLALEEYSDVKHEFFEGEIYAMAGGTPTHAGLAARVMALIEVQLPAGCRSYNSDLRVRVSPADLATYPDGTVICGETKRAADDPSAATNPTLVVEVTSASTEDYDRSKKLESYKMLATLREVLIVSHREPSLELHRRNASSAWTVTHARAGETLQLESVEARLVVDDLYRGRLEEPR
jgi:Uma2 family endonuclease